MQTLSSFPVITDTLLQKIRMQMSPFRFFYPGDDGEDHDLTADDTASSVHPLSDEHGIWSPDSDGFGINRTYTIKCASFLYGKNGVCCKDAVLGLALVWKSADSRQRSSIRVGDIEDTAEAQQFTLNKVFAKPVFRGRLDLETVVYIAKAGQPADDEAFLANIPGTVVGTLDSYSVQFDGSGSAFPVSIIHKKDGPLWYVTCDYDDPLTDSFGEDSISIYLNADHCDYKYINPSDKKNYNPSFLREVLANAMSTIVNFIREGDSWEDIKNGKAEDGSLGSAVYYFAKALDLNLDDAIQCSIAFRDYFEKKLSEL